MKEQRQGLERLLEILKKWISIDEITDCNDWMIADDIIGVLSEEDNKPQIFLLTTEELEATNHSTIANLFMNSLKFLGENFSSSNVLIFLMDEANLFTSQI
jgi:ABC-type polar amino acid transport system ATPase subunit